MRYFGLEILDHSDSAVDMSRLNSIGTALFNHDADKVIGRIDKAWLENDRGEAEITFDEDEYSQTIRSKVDSGSLRGVSVGYRVQNWEEVKAGGNATVCGVEVKGPCWIARKWQPLEISIVSVPADASVGVGRADEPESPPDNIQEKQKNKEERTMEKTPEQIAAEKAEQEKLQRELALSRDINEVYAMCRKYEQEPDKFVTDLRDGKTTLEQVRSAIMDKLAADNQALQTASVEVKTEEVAKYRAAAADALSMRAGVKVEKPAEGAGELRHFSLLRLAEDCLERAGVKTRGMDPMDLAARACAQRNLTSGAAGDFPYITGAIVNKSMMQAYNVAPVTWNRWCRVVSNPDFKTITRVQISAAPNLAQVYESGEYELGTMSDQRETYAIYKYGKRFSLTREAIINDDLGALNRLPALHGNSAARKVNSLVYAILTGNATMVADSATLFCTAHANYVATATANNLSVSSLGAARAAMMIQTDFSGKETLNITPQYLLVPAALLTTAEQLISSIVDPSKSNSTPNPFANRLQVVAEPLLDASSTATWYAIADYNQVDTVEVAFLNGNQAPVLEQRNGFEVDGIEYKVRLEVGCADIDYRGMYKAIGA